MKSLIAMLESNWINPFSAVSTVNKALKLFEAKVFEVLTFNKRNLGDTYRSFRMFTSIIRQKLNL